MNNIIKDAIGGGFKDYCEKNFKTSLGYYGYKEGWKEGYKWILTELNVRGYISDELLKRYTEALDE